MLNLKRILRSSIILFTIGLVVIGLASCKLPASKGPESASPTSDGFPVPGNTQGPGSTNVSTFATQTAQAVVPLASPTLGQSPYPQPTFAGITPVVTKTPSIPSPTDTPVRYVSATPGGPPATYILQKGEFPFCIARRFDVSLDELLTLNGLTRDSLLSIGQELKIPQTGNPFEGIRVLNEHPTTYKIQAADTLSSIACYFGDLSPDLIAVQNGLSLDANLTVGEVLVIP